MKNALIASALLLATPVHAVTVYSSDDMNFNIGGNLQIGVMSSENGGDNSTTVFDNGSRFHFAFDSQVNDDTKISGYLEWFINSVARNSIDSINQGSNSVALNNGTKDLFSLRQGYFSAENTHWGEFSIGKKMGAYQAVTGVTDYFNVFSAMASSTFVYGDGGISGTGRVDNGLFWSKQFGSDKHSVTVNLQGQLLDESIELTNDKGLVMTGALGEDISISSKGGVAASTIYALDQDKFTFGIGYSSTDAKLEGASYEITKPEAYTASVSSTIGDWYFAAVAASSEGMYQDNNGQIFSGTGFEVMLKREIGDWTPMIGWSHISADDYENYENNTQSQYELDLLTVSLNYNVRSLGFFTFIEATIDNGTKADGSDSADSTISVGMYYPF